MLEMALLESQVVEVMDDLIAERDSDSAGESASGGGIGCRSSEGGSGSNNDRLNATAAMPGGALTDDSEFSSISGVRLGAGAVGSVWALLLIVGLVASRMLSIH